MSNETPDYDDDFETYDETFDDVSEGGDDLDGLIDAEGDDDFDGGEDFATDEAAPEKKKSSIFKLAVIAVAVIGGGAIFWFQFGGKNTEPQAHMEFPSAAVENAPADNNPQAPALPQTAQIESDNTLLGGSDIESASTAIDTPTMAAPIRMPSAQDVMLKSSGDDVTPSVSDGDVMPAAPAPTVISEPTLSESAAPENAIDPAILESIQKTMTDIADRLSALESRVQAVQDNIESAPSAPSSSADIEALSQTVTKLQKTVSDLAKAPASSQAQAPVAAPRPQILGPADDEAQIESAPPVKAQATPRTGATDAPRWVLKGAQPGQAMVARAGQSETQTIRPGDTLPGIGRVTAIEYQDGQWVVRGTQGQIKQ
jgi:hypothetical protein